MGLRQFQILLTNNLPTPKSVTCPKEMLRKFSANYMRILILLWKHKLQGLRSHNLRTNATCWEANLRFCTYVSCHKAMCSSFKLSPSGWTPANICRLQDKTLYWNKSQTHKFPKVIFKVKNIKSKLRIIKVNFELHSEACFAAICTTFQGAQINKQGH